jgi:hypothetical protein
MTEREDRSYLRQESKADPKNSNEELKDSELGNRAKQG